MNFNNGRMLVVRYTRHNLRVPIFVLCLSKLTFFLLLHFASQGS
jgi:hypothetical protein